MPEIERLLLDNLPAPVSHYCHVVRAGDRVWVSGMVGIRKDGSIPEDVVDQFEVAMDWLDRALRAAGGRPEHIVRITAEVQAADPRISPFGAVPPE